MKRGQVTMFVILGIIIIMVIAAGFFLKDTISKSLNEARISKSTALQQQSKEITALIENCLQEIAEDAILEIAAQGGYFLVEEPIPYGFYSIPLYYNQGEEKTPSLSDIGDSIASYIMGNIGACELGLETSRFPVTFSKRVQADVGIAKDISISLDWKITLGDEEKATISEFPIVIETDIQAVYDKSRELYEKQKEEQLISLVDLARLAKDRDYVLHFDFAEDSVIYILTFEDIKINEEPIVYTFAIKLKQEETLTYEGEDFSELFATAEEIGDSQYGDSFEDYGTSEEEEEEEGDFEF